MKKFIKDLVTIVLGIMILVVSATACLAACVGELVWKLGIGVCAMCAAAIERLVYGSTKKKDKNTVNENVEATVE